MRTRLSSMGWKSAIFPERVLKRRNDMNEFEMRRELIILRGVKKEGQMRGEIAASFLLGSSQIFSRCREIYQRGHRGNPLPALLPNLLRESFRLSGLGTICKNHGVPPGALTIRLCHP